jgi:hypothetical protein
MAFSASWLGKRLTHILPHWAALLSRIWGLFDVDALAHHPQFKLLKTHFPAVFELPHPLAVPGAVGDIHDDPHKVIPVKNPTVAPVAFHLLGLVTSRTKVIHNFEHRLGDPFSWDVPSIIEPEG